MHTLYSLPAITNLPTKNTYQWTEAGVEQVAYIAEAFVDPDLDPGSLLEELMSQIAIEGDPAHLEHDVEMVLTYLESVLVQAVKNTINRRAFDHQASVASASAEQVKFLVVSRVEGISPAQAWATRSPYHSYTNEVWAKHVVRRRYLDDLDRGLHPTWIEEGVSYSYQQEGHRHWVGIYSVSFDDEGNPY